MRGFVGRDDVAQYWFVGFALIRGLGTACMKNTARGWVDRAGDVALQYFFGTVAA